MTPLETQLRRARWRLLWQRGMEHLARSLCGAAFVAVAIIFIVERHWPTGLTPAVWCAICTGAALVVAGMLTWITRASPLDTAREIDCRFTLHERVATALSLSIDERDTPAGQAVLADATRNVERLPIAERFGFTWGRWVTWPLLPILTGLILLYFLPPVVQRPAIANQQQANAAVDVQRSSQQLKKQLEERKREAESKGLKEAEDLFGKLERTTEEIAREGQTDRKQALIKLNDLQQQLEERQRELAGAGAVKQQLEQLRQLQQGPADRMLDAIKQGDLQRAGAELNQLREKLADNKLDDAAREQLQKQLEQVQQKLQAAAEAKQRAIDELQKKRDEAKADGRREEAEQLQQQLDQLRQQQGDGQQLEQLAQQLGKAAEAMKQGQNQQAAEHLQQLGEQLDQLNEQLAEGEMMEMALDQLADARQAMAGGDQAHAGKAQPGNPGQGQQPGQKKGQGQGEGPGKGNGIGKGAGQGLNNNGETPDAAYDTQVRQKVGKGSAVITGFVDGPNAKGRVQAQLRQEWQAVQAEQSDPVANQPLPRAYREHAERYFDGLRTGK